jgi:adenine-specific DNA-methyltransferase
MTGHSKNPQQDLLKTLKQNFPEIFSEGKVNCDALKQTLGEEVEIDDEQYGLNWAGKSNCFREIQETTTKTLNPSKEESVDFENTENLFIEGDNLEALKILQRSYYGKVKMIYIDPPYNTGNDFIYNDNFKKKRGDYLHEAGALDESGNLRKDGLQKNTKDRGHYHSDWLNMMYPRLFLAKNLLKQDGVIFVSIDDNEVGNLICLLNEIFGEENKQGVISWRRRHNQPNDRTRIIQKVSENILVYSKDRQALKEKGSFYGVPLSEKRKSEYSNPDNDPRGDWSSKPWKAGSNQSGSNYSITTPTGKVYDEEWLGSEDTFNQLLEEGKIYFPNRGSGFPRKKYYLNKIEAFGQSPTNFWNHKDFGSNQEATAEMVNLFGEEILFDNPKPLKLVKRISSISTADSDIILDFFAGSATTAHAIMDLNAEDGGNRKYILVQLPEFTEESSEAYKAGYKNIADIAKERIRRAAKKIQEDKKEELEKREKPLDKGFKVFKLKPSNFKIWQGNVKKEDVLKQMELFVDNIKEGSTQENILYELILKSGLDINVPIEKKQAADKEYFSLKEGTLIICLEKEYTTELMEQIKAEKSQKVILLDTSFNNNDQLKTNTLVHFENEKIEFEVI